MSNSEKYWENRLSASYGLESVGYIGLGKNYNNWLYKVRKTVFKRIVKSLEINLETAKVLDIGSGTGFYIDLWRSLGVKHIVGTDLTETAVKNLIIKFPDCDFHKVNIGLPLEPDLQHQTYNVVSAMDVLFHLVEDDCYCQAIENISELVCKGGFFIFSENFLHCDTNKGQQQVSRSLTEIESILGGKNFTVINRLPMQVIMNFPIDSESQILKKLWQVMAFFIKKHEYLGWLFGFVLYPLEILLTILLKESPTTEIMICRKQ